MCYVWFNKQHNSTHAMPFSPVNSFLETIYFFLAALGLWAACGEQGLLSSWGAGPLAAAASRFGAQALGVVSSGL